MKPIGIATIVTISLLPFLLVSQNSRVSDTGYINRLNNAAWNLRNSSLDSSKNLGLKALEISKRINYGIGIANSSNIIGFYYKTKSRYDSAFFYFDQSLEIRQKLKDTIGITTSLRNIMGLQKLEGKYDQAIKTGDFALTLLKSRFSDYKAKKEKAWIQTNLAPIYLKIGDYKSAIRNCLEAKVIFKEQSDHQGLAAATMNLGNIYDEILEFTKALVQFTEAVKLNNLTNNQKELAKSYTNIGNIYYELDQYNEALTNYYRGLKIRQKYGYMEGLSSSYLNIGMIYKSFDESDSALVYYEKCLELCGNSQNVEVEYELYRELGDFYRARKRFKESISYLTKALVLTISTKSKPEMLTIYRQLEESYNGLGKNDSALIYSRKYVALSDSLNEALRSSIVFESTLKDKEYQLAISKEKNRSQTYVIIGLTSFILLLCIILFLVFKSQRAKKKMLHLQELIKEQELMALDAMIEGQETERKRLAGELHDTIGSILSAIKFAFKAVENMVVPTSYKKINHMLDEALRTVRQISHDLASGVVLENGIDDALKQLCATLQDTGKIQIKLDIFGFNERAETTIELNIYRIIQELLTNILKHSQAGQVSIQLLKSPDNINLMVTDDGKGFNPASVQTKYGIGLSNIDKRVQNMSGRWNIDSGKGNGTTVVIDVPLNDSNT